MYTCDHCREQMWDDLFGLLEPGDSARLHRHVMACDGCRAEMEIALAEHRLVADAARLAVTVPPFTTPPIDEAGAFLNPPRPQSARRRRRFRMMPWLAAAVVLLTIGFPFGLYQYGRLRYQAAWRTAENSLAEIVQRRAELHSQAQAQRDSLVRAARASHLHLEAVGPAAYQLGGINSYRLWVSDLEGQPVDAAVTARVLDAGRPLVLDTRRSGARGQWLVDMPANLSVSAASTPCVELSVRGQEDVAPLRAYLRVLEPAYRTHLATDKPAYRAGDTIHFRSLTLERFGLRIPERAFRVIYTLADARGKELQTLRGLTRKDGIGGGDFTCSANWPGGEYTLTVAEAQQRFPPATCRLKVGPAASGLGKAAPPERLEVEFFPEGGELVAEVDNRVYFRVRTSLGRPADLQGAIVDSQGHEVAAVQTANREGQAARAPGLGMFTLRPKVGEAYRLQVTSPRAVELHAPLPQARPIGLCLSLPKAVCGPEEPIRALIQQTGPRRHLVVALFCQGQLVAQELVAANAGTTPVSLTPAVSCAGVLRVTVFEERHGRLWPLAERLAYRGADKRLRLSLVTDKAAYAPGETVRLHLQTRNEQGKPEPVWVLLSVTNQAAFVGATPGSSASLPAYFSLASELPQPEEMAQADLLLSDSPEAAAALDLWLGTQGWQRFPEETADAVAMAEAGMLRRAREPAVPAIVKLDNGAEVERRYVRSLSQALADWHAAFTRRDHELAREGGERLQAARTAAQELQAYEERAGELVRLAIGLGSVAAFATGGVLLGVALGRLVRRAGAHRGYLAGACAALSLCALALWMPASGWGIARNALDRARIAEYAEQLEKPFDRAALALPNNQGLVPNPALSHAAGPLPPAASAKQPLDSVASNTPQVRQGQSPPPVSSTRQPWIGILRAAPSSKPGSAVSAGKNVLAPALPRSGYAYDPAGQAARNATVPDTILWQPILFAQNGTVEISFRLPPNAATYCIRAEGHGAGGRLATVQKKLQCRGRGTD